MSGERPTPPDDGRPVPGTAAGTAYFALPPTAVDARPAGPTRLVVAWPGFDPPRGAGALAAAVPMTGVPTWRVYLELPGTGPGFDSAGLLETAGLEAYGTAVERAVEELPAVLAGVRRDLGIEDGPVALAGFSVGATVALLALARGEVPVSAVAAVAPIVSPALAAKPMERRSGRDRDWDEGATALAGQLDVAAHAARIAAAGAPLLFVGGATDRVTPAREITALCDLLRHEGAASVETATFRMEHALAAEPGTDPLPPSTEAVRVDAALTDWFRERFAEVVPEPAEAAESSVPAALEIAGSVHAAVEAVVVEPPPARSPMGAGPPADLPPAGPRPAGAEHEPAQDPQRDPAGTDTAGGGEYGDQVRLSTW
ncbi:hypothetical protein [Spirillospora sp. NPDC029432]|uniref:hypothetical protein n=1 Tax=Spirillospora sp. NPDC029432 TaxID=3154599 RepID=UPI003451F900